MTITIFGATGTVGKRIVAEALRRRHKVRAVARNFAKRNELPGEVVFETGDVARLSDVVSLTTGSDAVINATRTSSRKNVIRNTETLMAGLKVTGARLLVVGGAASLIVPGTDGRMVLDDARFLPAVAREIGEISLDQYQACLAETAVDWTYLSPPASLTPGKRTGAFRLGRDELLLDGEQHSQISIEDLAVAMLDEIEHPRFHRSRFTVAY